LELRAMLALAAVTVSIAAADAAIIFAVGPAAAV
jgi:hypothetical protein